MNYRAEYGWLEGAKLERVEQGEIGPRFVLALPEPVILNGKETEKVAFEVWRDEEGNGPGEFALVEVIA